jgi:hypothetical protein
MKPMVIFYHIYCYDHQYNKWQSTVQDQIQKINDSGLYDVCDSMFVRIIGNNENFEIFQNFIKNMKKIQILCADNNNDREATTLKAVHSYSQKNDANILYIHTKGVTTGNNRREKYTIKANHWRNLMEYFTIERWKQCIEVLNDGYDACGVLWRIEPFFGLISGHFSGNFWWATTKYIATLPKIEDKTHRGYHEFWIGRNNPKVYCFHESGLNHHRSYYPREFYERRLNVNS